MIALQSIRAVGGVVPPSLLAQLQAGELGSPESRNPASFHLLASESVRDAAARAWGYVRTAWLGWRANDARRQAGVGTGTAREQWLLPLFRELGYGHLPAAFGGIMLAGVEYPISHLWQDVPVHLLGPGVDLDRRNPGVAGAARAPQAMVQELLNHSDEHLWAFLTNGSRLRLLRDSTTLAGSAYLEFDLEAIFDGELYAEWLLLFQLCHESRLERRGTAEEPQACWLEMWRGEASRSGARALERLREGVEAALQELGSGFLCHRANGWLRDALAKGDVTTAEYHRQLLRLVYRLLFVFVAEDRGVLLDPAAGRVAHERYHTYFSTSRLRRLSRVRAGSSHEDIWTTQRIVLRALGGEGLPELGLPALGGLFDPESRSTIPATAPEPKDLLWGAELTNADLLAAVRRLAWIEIPGQRVQPVDYRHLGAEELGGVYESLLELVPRVNLPERAFALEQLSGNERKTTGSYYTPPSLVSALLDTALDPVIDRAAPRGSFGAQIEKALLALTVCDPACGSGGFLVAAARRIARRLAEVRAGEDQASPEVLQHAMRDVVGHCIYGVDLNDLAAELAKVSLWLEAIEPGKPLGFLDARIRVGNALLGTTPTLLADGVPQEAFKPLEGDDKKIAQQWAKRNKSESKGQGLLFGNRTADLSALAQHRLSVLDQAESVDEAREQAREWAELSASEELRRQQLTADAWCAAFVWPFKADAPIPPTTGVVAALSAGSADVYPETVVQVEDLVAEYRFFHWHLEFPEVFQGNGPDGPDGWSGGFSCLLGNPPWEHVELKEQEYFAARDPEIASASGAKRKKLIDELAVKDPVLHSAYGQAKRHIDGVRHFASSGRYPLTGRGRVKTDPIFAELFRGLTAPRGRTGIIVPTGIATDATTQHFFKDMVTTHSLAALYDFENAKPLFDGVHRSFKFCLLTMSGRKADASEATFAFFLRDPSEIATKEFSLTPEEITLLNPNTGTCPIFRTRRDAEITLGVYRRVPVLIKEGDPCGNPWNIYFMQGLFNMTSDSHLFRTRNELEDKGWALRGNVFRRGVDSMLPLYEAKMIHHYDHRWATYERGGSARDVTVEERQDAAFEPLPRYWVSDEDAEKVIRRTGRSTFLGWRDIARSTDERTTIFSRLPASPVGHTMPLMFASSPKQEQFLQAILSSFVVDFVARQKVGGTHLTYGYLMQFPVLTPEAMNRCTPWDSSRSLSEWLDCRTHELQATSDQMVAYSGEIPFVWDTKRRFALRAEVDAAFFHLYGVSREDAEYILDSFTITMKKDMSQHGECRTKNLILGVFDAMQQAIDTDVDYQTVLDPPPGQGPRHPVKELSNV